MHLSGVLGAIIPEFGNLYARVLHDLYHIYTVDRHSLVAVRELETPAHGRVQGSQRPCSPKLRASCLICRWCFLALLLHDIGKGHGHDHHERGASLTAEVSQRLGLNSEKSTSSCFLVATI